MPFWIEQVPTTSTIGVLFFKPSYAFIDRFYEFADLVGDRWGEVQVSEAGPGSYDFARSSDNLRLRVDTRNIIASYSYAFRVAKAPGRAPTADIVEVLPISDALDELAGAVEFAFGKLPCGRRAIQRIGFMLDARLDGTLLPPGVETFVQRLAHATGADELLQADTSLLRSVPSPDAATRDQCHHRITFDRESRPNDVNLILDYQRLWAAEQMFSEEALHDAIGKVRQSALEYAELLGTGDVFGEE